MIIHQREMLVPPLKADESFLAQIARIELESTGVGCLPLRFAVTASGKHGLQCELAELKEVKRSDRRVSDSIFRFNRRRFESTASFNVVLLVPTGIGAELGGHAGDATPVAQLIGAVCDTLITHPNVVNASDINELPANGLYVEGSVICRLMMGTAGLRPVRANRVLVVLDAHEDEDFIHMAVNSVSAARATYGLCCPNVVILDPPLKLLARYTSSGTAAGRVEGLERLVRVLDAERRDFDAVAIASAIDVPPEFHMKYFRSEGRMVNPWGGVEAMLTHAISSLYDVPSAHSPMMESAALAEEDPGVVDPRMSAEAVSLAFLQCILKGLHRSPAIVTGEDIDAHDGTLRASDVSCLVIPDGCVGLPTLAALEQGIPVIAVRENRNLMRNDLSALPWQAGKFLQVENYWEAIGVLAALKAGISPASTRRPLAGTNLSRVSVRCCVPQFVRHFS